MHGYAILFIAVLVLASKLISDLFSRINLPPVLGMILIGLAIGPTGFNLVQQEFDMEILKFFSEIGVVLLMFMAGLETDIEEMKKIGKNAFIIALLGVLVPLGMGYGVTYLFYAGEPNIHQVSLILGIILTATSVSVTVITLMDMKKMNTVEGNTILGAAIIDDVIGILLLTFVLGIIGGGSEHVGGESSHILISIGMIVGYLVGAILVGVFVIPWLLNLASKLRVEKPLIATALAVILIYAWLAERAEIAAITGAYMAGVFIGQTKFKHKIEEGINTIGHAIFISIFFVFIGLETNLRGNINWAFAIAYSVVAIISKIAGSGVAAKMVGFDWRRSMRIGSGMIPRGEVALVIATMVSKVVSKVHTEELSETTETLQLLNNDHFTAVVFMVIITAVVTPFLLKIFFKEKGSESKQET